MTHTQRPVVGAILPNTDGGDIDVVFLSNAPPYVGSAPLKSLISMLKHAPQLAAYDVWYVTANVPIIKIQRAEESLDLLWLPGCKLDETKRIIKNEDDDDRSLSSSTASTFSDNQGHTHTLLVCIPVFQ